jgi:toxin ParE1/3/4
MAEVRLSRRAAIDLEGLYIYSIENFGEAVTQAYRQDLEASFARLGDDPRIGRPLAGRTRTFFRLNCREHAIFFERTDEGDVIVVRVLHAAMDFKRHLPR